MVVIADSGGSKTDWRIISAEGVISQFKTGGLNPFIVNYEVIREEVDKLNKELNGQKVDAIYFYGAGCANVENSDLIQTILKETINPVHIEVNTDLLAAARALCGEEPGIIGILGTGASSCLYDGKKIAKKIPSLGYILGDEGSGAYMGKLLINKYFTGQMPEELASKLEKRFGMDRNEIVLKVYNGAQPAQYLATFSKFLFDNKKHPFIYTMIYESFKLFFERNVLLYKEVGDYPVHFSGSVAFYYNSIIRQAGKDLEISIKNIIESPIAGLTLFHQKDI